MSHRARATPPRRSRLAVTAAVIAVVIALTSLTACSSTLGLPDPATSQGDHVVPLWRTFVILAIAIAALIWVLVGVALVGAVRKRRLPDAIPVQRQQNTVLEIVYTAVPLAIVAVLFALTLGVNEELTAVSATPDLRVRVIGFQWQWQFQYPDQRIAVSGAPEVLPELVLPVGRTVELELVADDVIHSFWVPEFLEKRDLIPAVENRIQVYVKEPGRWTGRCAEYCGFDHWRMQFAVRAVPAGEFEQWVRDTQAKPQPVVEGQPFLVSTTTTNPQSPPTAPAAPVAAPVPVSGAARDEGAGR